MDDDVGVDGADAFGEDVGLGSAGLAGEGVKLAVMIAAFVIVLNTVRVSMGALLGAYIATFFVYWVALAGSASAFRVSADGSVGEQGNV